MDRAEVESIYEQGKEMVVTTILNLDAKCAELEKKLAALTKNSTNSNNPPSKDGPGVTRYPKKSASQKKQGAQPGHKGKNREMLPSHQVDHIRHHYPDRCQNCQRTITPEEKHPSKNPLERHQVWDLPPIKPVVTEHQAHGCRCPDCGHFTEAVLPKEITQSNFGAQAHAAIAYLTAAHRITRRGISDIMQNFFGLDICIGAVCDATTRVSEAAAPVVNTIKRYTQNALVLNIDETGWKNNKDRRYLWTFVSSLCVFFFISPSRGAKVLKEILGETFAGIIGSDDHSAYRSYHKNGVRQLCWAHLIRMLKGLKENKASPDAFLFAKTMLKEIGTLFSYWHAFLQSGCSRKELMCATALIRGRMKLCCQRYSKSKDDTVCTKAKRFLQNWEHLFTFLRVEGVEPTNNSAEQALRHPVLWRSICFGSKSEVGERFTERMLSVIGTCRMQRVNPFEFLSDLMTASFSGKPVPALPFLPPN